MPKVFLRELPNYKPDVLAVDLETTGLDPFVNRPLSITLSDGETVWIWLHTHINGQLPDKLVDWLTDPTLPKLLHNAEFDLRFIKHYYHIDVVNVWDTLLVENIIGNGDELPKSLFDVVARRCGVLLNKDTRNEFIDHPGFDLRPITSDQITYMAEDVLYLPRIKQQQEIEVSRDRLGRVVTLESSLLPVTVDMRLAGVKLDVPLWELYAAQIEAKVQEIEFQMVNLLGEGYTLAVPRTKKGQAVIEEIPVENIKWNSPSQMKSLINKELTGSKVKPVDGTGVDVLQDLLDKDVPDQLYKFLELLLKHRNWSKMAGWDYPKYVHPVTGHVHPEWRQMGAGTGRFSCSNPNFQNIPRPRENEPNLRRLWMPDSDDYRLIVLDYSQHEPRILGQLCQDRRLLEACNTEDVYLEFAKYLFGHEVDKKSEERYIAKQFVLATGYGAMPDKLHRASGLPLDRCTEIREMIMQTFPGIKRWGQEQYTKLKQFGYISTITGRRRYFPNQKQRIYTVAVNSPVQGTAADMMKLALVKLYLYLQNSSYDARIWACVHDEVEIHVHKDQAEELQPVVASIMEEAGHLLCPDVKHIAEGKILSIWDK